MAWTVMPDSATHEAARASFSWHLPDEYNPAVDLLAKHERPAEQVALYHDTRDGTTTYTFADLDERSDRLARGLAELGVEAGDRVGVVAAQRPETPLTHLACWKLGAISVPLTVLFGPHALQYRLADSEATAVVADPQVLPDVAAIVDDCPALERVVCLDDAEHDAIPEGAQHSFDALIDGSNPIEHVYEATPDTRSTIMYTSGSTGPPKGVLHTHALWLGRAAAAHNYFDQQFADATFWTPADWAWGAALGGTLFAAWHHGCPVVGTAMEGFDPQRAIEIIDEFGVTSTFMPPTALRLLLGEDVPDDLPLETIAAAGEPLTPEIVDWVADRDGMTINEFYGQTELNLVVGNCSTWFETRAGSMGKPFPGYDVSIRDPETGEPVPTGEVGEIAVRPHDDSVFFSEYWNEPAKTAAKRRGEWFLTGDLARRDEDGYLWFVSRKDDLIITSGYRVGPMEVEAVLLDHPAVEQVGVVGVPDETRGEIIKAYVQPSSAPDDPNALRADLRTLVREALAEYEYPREIQFVSELPTTTTGKIRRRDLRERADR